MASLNPERNSNRIEELYNEAFDRFGIYCLWHMKRMKNPTRTDAMMVIKGLKNHGDKRAWIHAWKIEEECKDATDKDTRGHNVRCREES